MVNIKYVKIEIAKKLCINKCKFVYILSQKRVVESVTATDEIIS